jgi:hypothetical protein
MAAELGDLKRLKISAETRAWLQAEAHTTGRSQQEIARDVLHDVALQKIHAARVLASLAPADAHAGATRGHPGTHRGQAGSSVKIAVPDRKRRDLPVFFPSSLAVTRVQPAAVGRA